MNNLRNNISVGLGLIVCLVGFPQISETIYTPALPSVAYGLTASVHSVEATLAIYFLGFALGVCLWGSVSDWIGRRRTMLIGLLIFIISCSACSLSNSIGFLIFWRLIQAFGASVGSVITQTILRDIYHGKQRVKIFSILSGALAFSPALGPLIGGFISEYLGWRVNFLTLLTIGIALFIWSFVRLPETKPEHTYRPSMRQIFNLAKNMFISKRLWGHIVLIGATNGILFSFYEEAPFIFVEQLGIRPSLYGLLGILIALGTIVAARMSYFLSNKYTAEWIIQLGSYITFLGSLGLSLLQFFDLFTLSYIGMTLSLSFLFVVFMGIGLIIPNSLSIALKAHQKTVGTAGSLFGTAYYLLIALETWTMSLLHNGTAWPLPLFLTFLGLLLICGSRMTSHEKRAAISL